MTFQETPLTTRLYALNDCLRHVVSVDPADYQITPFANAVIEIEFLDAYATPPFGTNFSIWGFDFSVEATTTASSFFPDGLAEIGAPNFALMIRSNVKFAQKVKILIETLPSSNVLLTILWLDCGVQPNFSAPQTDLSGLSGITASITVTNGVDGENRDNFRLLTALSRVSITSTAPPESEYVTEFNSAIIPTNCGVAEPFDVDPAPDIAPILYTPIPSLDVSADVQDESNENMRGFFSLSCGFAYTDNCVWEVGDMIFAPNFEVINAAFRPENVYGIREYTDKHPDGLAPNRTLPKPLTTQPEKHYICSDSNAWLWHYLNQSYTTLSYRFRVTQKDNTLVTYTSPNAYKQGIRIAFLNASVNFVSLKTGVPQGQIKSYEVSLISGSNETHTPMQYILLDCDCNSADLYFLSEAGGFVTIPVKVVASTYEKVLSESFFNQILCGIRGNPSGVKRALKSQRVFRRLELRALMPSKSEDALRMYADCVRSSVHYIREKDHNGFYVMRRFVLDEESKAIGPNAGGYDFELKGILQDETIQEQLR